MRCGQCGKPICPDCMHHGPVGARCAECYGELPGGPKASSRDYLLAAAVGTPAALAAGYIAGLIGGWGCLFNVLVGVGCGLIVGMAVKRVTDKGLAVGLQALVGMIVVFGVFGGALLAAAQRAMEASRGFGSALTQAAQGLGLLVGLQAVWWGGVEGLAAWHPLWAALLGVALYAWACLIGRMLGICSR